MKVLISNLIKNYLKIKLILFYFIVGAKNSLINIYYFFSIYKIIFNVIYYLFFNYFLR